MTISTILLHTCRVRYIFLLCTRRYMHTHMHMHIPHHILPTERISANVALFDPYLIVIKGWEQNAVNGSGLPETPYTRAHTYVQLYMKRV